MKRLYTYSLFCLGLFAFSMCAHKPITIHTNANSLPSMDSTNQKHANHLINESSPYLLQHAHNPVDWYPWNDEALEKAKRENKLILVSIGYAACHWCHVMEHESFEDEEVAKLMNEHFVCIKVDREERPDIDLIYMKAVQLMTQRGGWPLNCIALPDGRPIYGGTYFTKAQWKDVLVKISSFYKKEPTTAENYAEELAKGVVQSDLIRVNPNPQNFNLDSLSLILGNWKNQFDLLDGGMNYAPKFPMPNNYLFLLHYYQLSGDESVLKFVMHSLNKIAFGGIYDHLGGGFARYSTDMKWKVPHFEKMLYDNAQLVSLYVNAYRINQNPLYKKVVYETLGYIEREMCSEEGGFYSSLDADSEGKEGKFYIWDKEELKTLPLDVQTLFFDYYNVNKFGYWEENQYILLRKETDSEIAKKHGISETELQERIESAKKILFELRKKRIRPALDDKQLCSWNALMLNAYIEAYLCFKEPEFLQKALASISFIEKNFLRVDGSLYHNYKSGKSSINGFLEDYAFLIESYILLYELGFEQKYLEKAELLTEYAGAHFSDAETGMYYFTSKHDTALFARKMEIMDNVIPASNSQMAKNLFKLGHITANESYTSRAGRMLNNVVKDMHVYPAGYSNWGMLYLNFSGSFYEIVISGAEAVSKRMEFGNRYLPNTLFAGAESESTLSLLKDRFVPGKTKIYVCRDKVCQLPLEKVSEALTQLK